MLQQFHHGQTTLTEARDNERTTLVALSLEVVEGCADVANRKSGTILDCDFVLSHPGLHGGVAIERREEAVARRHIRHHLVDLQIAHVLAMLVVPHVGIVAYPSILRRPVFLPRRYDVEDVGSRAIGVAISGHPHGRVLCVITLRRTRCKRGCTTKQDGGYHPLQNSAHNYLQRF